MEWWGNGGLGKGHDLTMDARVGVQPRSQVPPWGVGSAGAPAPRSAADRVSRMTRAGPWMSPTEDEVDRNPPDPEAGAGPELPGTD